MKTLASTSRILPAAGFAALLWAGALTGAPAPAPAPQSTYATADEAMAYFSALAPEGR